jgi:hypothetical protein
VAMPPMAGRNRCAGLRVERGEQRRHSMPFVVVRLACGYARAQRQNWLRPIQRLYLALPFEIRNGAEVRGILPWFSCKGEPTKAAEPGLVRLPFLAGNRADPRLRREKPVAWPELSENYSKKSMGTQSIVTTEAPSDDRSDSEDENDDMPATAQPATA